MREAGWDDAETRAAKAKYTPLPFHLVIFYFFSEDSRFQFPTLKPGMPEAGWDDAETCAAKLKYA